MMVYTRYAIAMGEDPEPFGGQHSHNGENCIAALKSCPIYTSCRNWTFLGAQ